ncbi:MAG: ribonucleoside-diphosphate reductase alpha chain [Elusimicrobia bacterium]|nr:MAG: ribonucleoside-diphosphate reductase alpha chain [Elusimicrobiota bacterium]
MQTNETAAADQTLPPQPLSQPDAPVAMRVRKRNGALEPVDVNKIVRAVARAAEGLPSVDTMRVATRTIGGLYDGATSRELDGLSIQTAASLIAAEPEYSLLAARLLSAYVSKEVSNQNIHSFSQSVAAGHALGLVADEAASFVAANSRKLNDCIDDSRDALFEYFGLRTVYDRYLLRHPRTRQVIETPQHFFLRVACGLARSVSEAQELYRLLSSFDYMTSSPTLFNSGTRHPQMSSCYLVDSPKDELESIYDRYKEVAQLSKFSGGIALAYHRIRARGSLIKGTNGKSNGIIPWLKTLDASVSAVNQGGKRKGACCVSLESWHADIEEFLEMRDNTGDPARRTHNLNLANWIPDLFMRRANEDGMWSLFDPKDVPHFPDLFGDAFEAAYAEAEAKGLAVKQVKARELYGRMMRTLAETGNGWMTFKDVANRTANQTGRPGNVVHSSNLCTEILEVNNDGETAVCNLGSVNLARHVSGGQFDFGKLAYTVRTAVKFLDRVVDINFYPTAQAEASNRRWRPVGLGVMGLQDVFFLLGMPFDSAEARELSRRIAEEIYYHALLASAELAEESGAHAAFPDTRLAQGKFHFELYGGAQPRDPRRWDDLRARILKTGVRNALVVAIAPTATIASIVGACECIEPQVSNVFKRETLSGEFMQVNKYLVADLKKLGLWDEAMRNRIKLAEGSVLDIAEIPAELRQVYRTAWELPQRALIDMAAERGAYIDQSQSLNLFVESPNIGKLSSMYMHAWKAGLKTTYYLRSRPATRIAKSAHTPAAAEPVAAPSDAEGVACSLENPESCESCQ